MHCKSLWIKASAKCINVNVINVIEDKTGPDNLEKLCHFLLFPTQMDCEPRFLNKYMRLENTV